MKLQEIAKNTNIDVYIDGSYNFQVGQYGVGILMVDRSTDTVLLEKGYPLECVNSNTQLHEWYALLAALTLIHRLKIEKCVLYTDQLLIVDILMNGKSLIPNNPIQDTAYALYRSIQSDIEIRYLKSHSGNKYNNRVDELSKWASGTKNINTEQLQCTHLKYAQNFSQSLCVPSKNKKKASKIKKFEIDSDTSYAYFLKKVQATNLPLNTKWVPWAEFCRKTQAELAKDRKTMKLKKLRNNKRFKKDFEILHIGQEEKVRRKK